jgi:hypothetical protein
MYQIIVIQVVSKHKTKRAASAALKRLTEKHGEMAMVVEVPEDNREKK